MGNSRIGTSTAESSFEQTLIEVWRQALVENAKVVKLGKERDNRRGIQRTVELAG